MGSVFIFNNHPALVEGIRSLLGLKRTSEAMNTGKWTEHFDNSGTDVLFMDINLPDITGSNNRNAVNQENKGVCIIGLGILNETAGMNRMIENSADGYVLKTTAREGILEAIELALKGETSLNTEAGEAISKTGENEDKIPALTRREKEVLELIAQGHTNPEIAEKLFISPWTVDSHRKSLHAKFKVKNSAMLIRYAIEHKLV